MLIANKKVSEHDLEACVRAIYNVLAAKAPVLAKRAQPQSGGWLPRSSIAVDSGRGQPELSPMLVIMASTTIRKHDRQLGHIKPVDLSA